MRDNAIIFYSIVGKEILFFFPFMPLLNDMGIIFRNCDILVKDIRMLLENRLLKIVADKIISNNQVV